MSESKEEEDSHTVKGKPRFSDKQRTHLSKLMANPDKPVSIPEGPKRKKPKEPPEFVRFYMGSSAGAGSEVFHVYRHLRRRENDRQQIIQENAQKDDEEKEFQEKLLANKLAAEAKTSKKRAKRLKKKQKRLEKKKVEESGSGEEKSELEAANEEKAESSNDEEEQEPHFSIGGR